MKRYKLFGNTAKSKFVAAIAAVLLSGPAFSACSQADLTGLWWFNGLSGNSTSALIEDSIFCKIRFGTAGGVSSPNSLCKSRTSAGEQNVAVTGGKYVVNNACWVNGQVRFCNQQVCDTFKILDGRMSEGKDTITLVGYYVGQPNILTQLTAVKTR